MAMKKTLLLIITLLASLSISSQNYNATAFNINGEKLPLLFSENDKGDIVYSDVVNIEGDFTQIRQAVKDYIEEQKGLHELEIKYEVDNSKRIVAKIVCPINKQYWAVEIWGSPVVSGLRDASRITFKCAVDFLNNKFKYTLSDFWTDNRRISGEAKDNGPTNIIYQQRVNSLQKEYDDYASSHNSSKRSVKEKIYDLKSAVDYEKYQYVDSYNAVMNFIKGLREVQLFNANGDFVDQFTSQSSDDEKGQSLDLTNFHGNLLGKGNSVYVPSEGLEPYEKGGVQELIKQISVDEFWKIVNSPRLAHFIIEYHMSTEGRDHAWLVLKSADGKTICSKISGNHTGSSESLEDNHESARTLYMSVIYPLIQKLDNNKTDKIIKLFDR